MFHITFHPNAYEDTDGFPANDVDRIEQSINSKLKRHPQFFGIKLAGVLKNYWKLRVGDFRIIYNIKNEEIYILAIGDRKNVYRIAERRLKSAI